MPAFMMIMMTIKRTRNLNQTINLVSKSDEAEIMPNGGRYDKEKSITPGSCCYANGPSYHWKDQRPQWQRIEETSMKTKRDIKTEDITS